MRIFNLPIMLGCYDKADKCSVAVRNPKLDGMSVFICHLKKQQDYGTPVDMENVGNVICQLHFCKLEAAKAFLEGLIDLVKRWEADDD